MKLGMNLPVMAPGLDREAVLDWARRIDAGPFATLAAGERITFPNPEMLVTLSIAAAVTERVRLGFYVMVLPLHPAALAAKQIASLDRLSGGRVSLGVGVGGREEDYRAVGAPFDTKRWSRLEEQVDFLRRAWAGEAVIPGALRPIEPAPLQPGGPEILAGSLYPKSIRRAARWADGIAGFSFGPGADEIRSQFETARKSWTEAGRPRPPRLVTGCWFALGAGAREQLDRYLARYLAFLGPEAVARIAPSVSVTSAEALRGAARMAEDLGADELVLVPTSTDAEQIDRVADLLG